MFKKIAANLVCSLFLCSLLSANVFGCACCAEPGTYLLRTSKPDKYTLDLISEFRFAEDADLYMTEAGFDIIRGLDPVKKEDEENAHYSPGGFDLVATFTNRIWRFNVKTPKGLKGSLVLPLPTQVVEFDVDIHDEEDRPNGPILYKEFRFKGNVASAEGFTRGGFVRGTTYFLVFQGRGNGCDNAGDFTHWRLEIDGPKAKYAFFGKLDSAGEEASRNSRTLDTFRGK